MKRFTIDEIIVYEKKCSERSDAFVDYTTEEHKQIAEWLEELVDYRRFNGAKTFDNGFKQGEKYCYNKAIDEFVEVLRLECLDSVYKEVSLYNILKIAEQLKVGEKNES